MAYRVSYICPTCKHIQILSILLLKTTSPEVGIYTLLPCIVRYEKCVLSYHLVCANL